ncbi:MAG: aldehyde:ferredoxin oxidoreductase [Deltaproteobacteria bacterium]|nr:aldehyde:ferredoxin oxidoreductase [Deltaproteobacteria bacterium]
MNGYAGKILRIDLTRRKISTIETRKYEQWGGGHGMGSALFWDLAKEKAVSGFDPRNVVTIMTSPLTGTLVPGASSRTEVQGIGVQSHPVEWFTRSNFGGRFGPMLKYAGWDGIVVEGKASKPVWIDFRDGDVRIRDAGRLWGMDAWAAQQEIWRLVAGGRGYGDWLKTGPDAKGGRTVQRPAVLTIGPSGERLGRIAALIHDAGNAAGQGGFGGVWGSKNLKAVSVWGSGAVHVADPKALVEARLWLKREFSLDADDPRVQANPMGARMMLGPGSPPVSIAFWKNPEDARPQACAGCPAGCRSRYGSGKGNESACADSMWYVLPDLERHQGKQTDSVFISADLCQKYGINACELLRGLPYVRDLHKMGVLGPGKAIDTDLSFEGYGSTEFVEGLLRMIAERRGIGNDMAEGFYRAAERWGRLKEDARTGLLAYPHWGLPLHYEPRAELEWGYGSIVGDREVNEHAFNWLFWLPSGAKAQGAEPPISAEEIVTLFSEKLVPYQCDVRMLDYANDNMYSEHMAKLVAWDRHYSRFWKQSLLFCDGLYPNFVNMARPDGRGVTGIAEPRFFKAVTGRECSFADGIELGRKIWNLDNAIWTLQGRHRDMVHFAEHIYTVPLAPLYPVPVHYLPGRENGKWTYVAVDGRHLDKNGFDEWKTRYYALEGWDPKTGWPLKSTLDSLGLPHVAEELTKKRKLGRT